MDQKINNFNVVLLVAGSGKRISNFSKLPKCLLKVGQKTILERNLSIWNSLGLKNIFIVLGYKSKSIEKELKKVKKNLKIRKIYNKNYSNYGNSFSLFLALKKIHGPVVIFDGDLVYDKKILLSFLYKSPPNSILTGPGKPSDIECAKVLIDKDNSIKKIVDKESIKNKKYIGLKFLGEALGIIKLSNLHTQKLRYSLKNFLSVKENLELNWEKALNHFLLRNKLNYYFTKSKKWIEIDLKKDFIKALKIIKKYNI